MYPRTGCALFGKQLVKTFGVKSNHHLIPNDKSWCGTASIFVEKVVNGTPITADVAVLVNDTSLREIGLECLAGWSPWLREDDDCFIHGYMRRLPEAVRNSRAALFVHILNFDCDLGGLLQHG